MHVYVCVYMYVNVCMCVRACVRVCMCMRGYRCEEEEEEEERTLRPTLAIRSLVLNTDKIAAHVGGTTATTTATCHAGDTISGDASQEAIGRSWP